MICYERYRIEESKIRRRMGTHKGSDRYISLYLSRYWSLCLYLYDVLFFALCIFSDLPVADFYVPRVFVFIDFYFSLLVLALE